MLSSTNDVAVAVAVVGAEPEQGILGPWREGAEAEAEAEVNPAPASFGRTAAEPHE